MALRAEQLENYRRDGYLVVEGFVAAEACDRLIARAAELIAGLAPGADLPGADLPGAHLTVFSTDADRRPSNAYFLHSGDKIRFFFEADAVDRDGRLAVPITRAINKIGHAMHDLDPVFSAFSRTPKLAAIAADLGIAEPLLLQSMYIFKQPGIGGEVGCHQDATFLYTEPASVVGFWFALEDARVANGCLRVIPGGHRTGLKARFARTADGGLAMATLDASPWPTDRLVPLETPKGSLVVLHGLAPHYSGPNRSPDSRHAYALHVIDGTARYPADNWLRRGAGLPLKGF